MESGVLYFPPERSYRNMVTGRYLPGHIPHNKGKSWSDYTSKRAQQQMRKGWKNLQKCRAKKRPDTSKRCSKRIIAILPNNRWLTFPNSQSAGLFIDIDSSLVRRCCRLNDGPKKNDNHKCKGIRFYWEISSNWINKIESY